MGMDPQKIDTGPLEPCFWKCTSSALSPRNALREKKNAKHVFCYFTRKRLPAASILPQLRANHCATGPPKDGRNCTRERDDLSDLRSRIIEQAEHTSIEITSTSHFQRPANVPAAIFHVRKSGEIERWRTNVTPFIRMRAAISAG